MHYEFDLMYYITLFKKWWKAVVFVSAISMLLTGIFELSKPTTYSSTATFISKYSDSSTSAVESLLGVSLRQGGSTDYLIPLLYSRRMSDDIRKRFGLDAKPKFSYGLSFVDARNTSGIQVDATDPGLAKEIANFVIQNLDKLNDELDLTTQPKMVRVLDPPLTGKVIPKRVKRKMILSGLVTFLIANTCIVLADYIKALHILDGKKGQK